MRIGIDARPLSKQRTGIANYIEGLVQLLPQIAPQHDYYLYSNRKLDGQFSDGIRERIDSAFRRCPGAIWLLGRIGSLARRDQIDVFWATYPLLPLRLPGKVWKVVTVYDLVWLRFPETTSKYNLLVQKAWSRRAIAEADLIIVISRSTQQELVQSLGVPIAKTRVVYPGISEMYHPQEQQGAAKYISVKYRVPCRYMAFVGSVEPRKNLKLLVEVLRILKGRNQLKCPLLIAGASGWKNSSLFEQIQAAGLSDQEIRFLGYLPDCDLPSFYAGAQLFLFPSLYEGFGLPPLEAMASGTPVIASDARCMPEVLGDAAILVPPTDAELFAAAIRRVLVDDQVRHDLRTKGIRRASTFRCETSARQLLGAFEMFSRGAFPRFDPKGAVTA